jgi:two-component system phosphate regulon sensor histidine kinase PhoR
LTTPPPLAAIPGVGRTPFWRRLFWQVFFAQLLIIALVISAVGVYFIAVVERNVDEVIEYELSRTAAMALLVVEPAVREGADLQALLEALAEQSDIRATMIDATGRVLADSEVEQDIESMSNHADRPEVRQALADGTGRALRVSDTIGIRQLYYARRVDADGQRLVFRVAIPYAEISSRVQGMRTALLLALIVAAACGAALSFAIARHVARPVNELTNAVSVMAEGHFDVRIPSVPPGELQTLRNGIGRLRTQLSEKLRQVEEEKTLLLTILSAMTEGLIVVDATGRVILVNPMALRLLGVDDVWKRQNVEDRLLIEVTRNPQLIELVEKAIRQGESLREDIESRRGVRRYLKVSIAPLKEDDAVRGAVAALHDITQLRQLERVRRDFVANVSHELRTPIAAIRGWAETLTSGMIEMPDFVEEQLFVILRHSERLGALVDDLLALARVEALGIEDAFVKVDVRELIDDILEQLDEKVVAREMTVDVRVSDEIREIRSEPRALEYVLRNLIDNGVKYTPEGGRVEVSVESNPAGDLEFSVSDNGQGIEEQHLPRIFERFYRIDKGRSRDVGGTGLGLSIVKHFAEALGGSVSVESEVGSGSRFTVVIPRHVWRPRERVTDRIE